MKCQAKDLKVGDLIKLSENSPNTWEVFRLGFPTYPRFRTYIELLSMSSSVKGDSGAAVRANRSLDSEETVYVIGRV